MLQFVTGNLFETNAEAIVNTVNTVGVMGKGVALQFKERFPENYELYVNAAKKGEVQIGKMFVTHLNRMENPLWIINFPTKKHWMHRSSYEYIISGLDDFIAVLKSKKIKSVAMPPLGAGQGRLDWNKVKDILKEKLSGVEVDFLIFEPGSAGKKNTSTAPVLLTTPRALVLSLIDKYKQAGYDSSLLEVQKLAYFLQRVGQKDLKLNYEKFHYGPYAHNLQHLLHHLEQGYIKAERSILDSKPLDLIDIVPESRQFVREYLSTKCTDAERSRLRLVEDIISGFESPFGLELIATVDMIIKEAEPGTNIDVNYIKTKLWTQRKVDSFSERQIGIALEHLKKYQSQLLPTAA